MFLGGTMWTSFGWERRTGSGLIALLSDLPPYCCLVFAYGASEYKPDRRQKKLFEAISRNATGGGVPQAEPAGPDGLDHPAF